MHITLSQNSKTTFFWCGHLVRIHSQILFNTTMKSSPGFSWSGFVIQLDLGLILHRVDSKLKKRPCSIHAMADFAASPMQVRICATSQAGGRTQKSNTLIVALGCKISGGGGSGPGGFRLLLPLEITDSTVPAARRHGARRLSSAHVRKSQFSPFLPTPLNNTTNISGTTRLRFYRLTH